MAVISKLMGKVLSPQKSIDLEPVFTFDIAGMRYLEDSIGKAGTPLKGYKLSKDKMEPYREYYKYSFDNLKVKLVPEPTNKADKDAIMVKVNGVKVGYVPARDTAKVRKYLPFACDITANISGGPYRYYQDDKNAISDGSARYHGTVTISLK